MSGKAWPVSLMCEELEVSASGYFSWKRMQDEAGSGPSRFQSDEALMGPTATSAHIPDPHAVRAGPAQRPLYGIARVLGPHGRRAACAAKPSVVMLDPG